MENKTNGYDYRQGAIEVTGGKLPDGKWAIELAMMSTNGKTVFFAMPLDTAESLIQLLTEATVKVREVIKRESN